MIVKQINWESQLNDLLFTLQSYHKDEFPFGFEAFGIADLRGPPGFVSEILLIFIIHSMISLHSISFDSSLIYHRLSSIPIELANFTSRLIM